MIKHTWNCQAACMDIQWKFHFTLIYVHSSAGITWRNGCVTCHHMYKNCNHLIESMNYSNGNFPSTLNCNQNLICERAGSLLCQVMPKQKCLPQQIDCSLYSKHYHLSILNTCTGVLNNRMDFLISVCYAELKGNIEMALFILVFVFFIHHTFEVSTHFWTNCSEDWH